MFILVLGGCVSVKVCAMFPGMGECQIISNVLALFVINFPWVSSNILGIFIVNDRMLSHA